jgi:hypothetical protein
VRAGKRQGSGVQISFSYPDRQKAQAVVQALTTRILHSNEIGNQVRVKVWRELRLLSLATPLGDSVEVLDAASLAEKASFPNRPMMIAFGLLAGLLLGLVAAFLKRRPKWTLQMAGFAAGGCGLAAGLSLLIADSYTSTAVVRITRPIIPAYLLGSPAPAPPAELFRQLQQRVLVRKTLQEIMQKPSLNLYPNERARRPLEEVIEKMRGDIHIDELNVAAVPGHPSAFQISFSYADRYKAQAVVDELITRFVKENLREVRAKWKESELDERAVIRIAHGTNGVEVLDPASLPRAASWPNRLVSRQ